MQEIAQQRISIHALLAESDNRIRHNKEKPRHFYPRSPCGERRYKKHRLQCNFNFYPRSPCGERQPTTRRHDQYNVISIHALLAESDTELPAACTAMASISIHALLAESDRCKLSRNNREIKFLSTLSLRRATIPYFRRYVRSNNFYPRSPCGERHFN